MQSRGTYFYIEDLSGYKSRGRCRDLCGRQISKGMSWFLFLGVWRLKGREKFERFKRFVGRGIQEESRTLWDGISQ